MSAVVADVEDPKPRLSQSARFKLLADELGIDDVDDKSTSDRLKAIEDRHGAKHGETNRARLAYLENAVGPKPNPTHSQVERCKQLETHMGMDVCDIRVGIRYTYISGNVGPVPKPVKNQSQTCKFQFGTVVYSLQSTAKHCLSRIHITRTSSAGLSRSIFRPPPTVGIPHI